jgi:hypothetical protein
MNNWFSGPYLYDKLYSKQNDSMNTLHQNRKWAPDEIKRSKIEKRRAYFHLQRQIDDNEVER